MSTHVRHFAQPSIDISGNRAECGGCGGGGGDPNSFWSGILIFTKGHIRNFITLKQLLAITPLFTPQMKNSMGGSGGPPLQLLRVESPYTNGMCK